MRVWLLTTDGYSPKARYGPLTPPFVVGRGPEAALRLDDRFVSRRHCSIDQVSEGLILRDLNATHGTYLNGERVTEAPLKSGDRISIGLTTFRIRYDGVRQRLRAIVRCFLPKHPRPCSMPCNTHNEPTNRGTC